MKHAVRRIGAVIFYSVLTVIFVCTLYYNAMERKAEREDTVNSEGWPPSVGSEAPGFSMKGLDSEIKELKEYSDINKLLVFWSIESEEETPILEHLNELITPSENTVLLAVNTVDSEKDVLDFAGEKDTKLNLLCDYKKSVKWAYKVDAFPTVYLIDINGKIIYRQISFRQDNLQTLMEKMEKLN